MKKVVLFLLFFSVIVFICRGETHNLISHEEFLQQSQTGNFILYVSNQSFTITSVDITIMIDGKNAVAADFVVGNQHKWIEYTFRLAPGNHKLIATSKKGSAKTEKIFEIHDKHWAVVDFWFSKKDKYGHFSFSIQNSPIGFM